VSDIRTININLIGGNIVVENNVLGFQGEHNATTLSIVPPDEMTNCEDIVAYKVAFELNNCRHTRSELLEKTSPITVRLSSQITSSKEISVQIEGYSADGNLLVKSPKITKLTFADSVGGVSADYENEGSTASDIAANTLARHTHKNLDLLNNLGENAEGKPTYKGEVIGRDAERQTAEWLIEEFDASEILDTICHMGVYNLPVGVNVGTEVKDVLIQNSEGVYISIRNLASEDNILYVPLFDKICENKNTNGYDICLLGIIDDTKNWVMEKLTSFAKLNVKVIYYKN
jgi:hypothetical protein